MIARYSRMKLVLTMAGSIAFVVLAVWLFVSPEFGDKAKFAAFIGVPFFGAIAIFAARSLFDSRPVLTIEETGVFDRRSMDRKVPWTEVAGIAEMSVRNKIFFYLDVGDPVDRFTTGGLKRWLLNANQGFGKGVTVSPHTLDVPPDKVRAALEKFAPKG